MLLITTSDRKDEKSVKQETVTLFHLDDCSILDGAQLRVAVKRDVPQPERETRAVAGDLMLHQGLVQLPHQHLTRDLTTEQRGLSHHCMDMMVSNCYTSQPEVQSFLLQAVEL